jgi:flagellar capping protein FliD
MAETVAAGVVGQLLAEYVKKAAEKALAGKKLSDWEVGILMMNQLSSSLGARISSLEKSLEAKINSLEERIASIDEKYDARISSLEEKYDARISSLEKSFDTRISSLEKSLDARISSLEERLEARISSLEKRIEKVELDMDYLKRSLDSLRDNVVNVLVAELKARREKE